MSYRVWIAYDLDAVDSSTAALFLSDANSNNMHTFEQCTRETAEEAEDGDERR
jgi:hypothetical protein